MYVFMYVCICMHTVCSIVFLPTHQATCLPACLPDLPTYLRILVHLYIPVQVPACGYSPFPACTQHRFAYIIARALTRDLPVDEYHFADDSPELHASMYAFACMYVYAAGAI